MSLRKELDAQKHRAGSQASGSYDTIRKENIAARATGLLSGTPRPLAQEKLAPDTNACRAFQFIAVGSTGSISRFHGPPSPRSRDKRQAAFRHRSYVCFWTVRLLTTVATQVVSVAVGLFGLFTMLFGLSTITSLSIAALIGTVPAVVVGGIGAVSAAAPEGFSK
ncbi:MAG: hypothetical protein L0I29_12560 [Hyphomicrobiales bacterium]|nr:hypothetical protein [Hyphomicrobiales bacterium]